MSHRLLIGAFDHEIEWHRVHGFYQDDLEVTKSISDKAWGIVNRYIESIEKLFGDKIEKIFSFGGLASNTGIKGRLGTDIHIILNDFDIEKCDDYKQQIFDMVEKFNDNHSPRTVTENSITFKIDPITIEIFISGIPTIEKLSSKLSRFYIYYDLYELNEIVKERTIVYPHLCEIITLLRYWQGFENWFGNIPLEEEVLICLALKVCIIPLPDSYKEHSEYFYLKQIFDLILTLPTQQITWEGYTGIPDIVKEFKPDSSILPYIVHPVNPYVNVADRFSKNTLNRAIQLARQTIYGMTIQFKMNHPAALAIKRARRSKK